MELRGFQTDLCTMFPEGTVNRPGVWKDCCIYHDLKYWIGGTKKEQYEADVKLRECVRSKTNWFYAGLMYKGVRLGHYSPIKNKYQWGWGWHKKGWFGQLNKDQLDKAKSLIIGHKIDPKLKNKFIQEYLNY